MTLFRRRSAPEPTPMATPHPLMQAHVDLSLPFVVASDHAVWGSFPGLREAARLADDVALTQPIAERVIVLLNGKNVYQRTGMAAPSVEATRRG